MHPGQTKNRRHLAAGSAEIVFAFRFELCARRRERAFYIGKLSYRCGLHAEHGRGGAEKVSQRRLRSGQGLAACRRSRQGVQRPKPFGRGNVNDGARQDRTAGRCSGKARGDAKITLAWTVTLMTFPLAFRRRPKLFTIGKGQTCDGPSAKPYAIGDRGDDVCVIAARRRPAIFTAGC